MKRIMLISLLLTSLLATSDVNKEYVVRHRLQLTEVTCNHDCGFVQGITEEPFTDIDGVESCRYRYADDVINMAWYASEIAFNFSFVNKLDKDMTLLWNDMRVQVFDGERVALGNTMQKPKQFVAAEIRAHSGMSGFLIPLNDYPIYKTLEPIMPIVPGQYVYEREARKAADKHNGKTIHLTFPVHVDDEAYVYELTFVVGKAEAILYRVMGEEDVVTPMGDISSSKTGGSRLAAARREKKTKQSAVVTADATTQPDMSIPSSEAQSVTAAPAPPLPAYAALLNAMPEPRDTSSVIYRLITYAAHTDYFNQLCPQEKVYLHLDNTAYFQGETIWYAANVVGQSKVLYVELLSPTGVVLKQQKLKVVDGRCHGSFTLIDSAVKEAVEKRGAIGYPSGYYQIRAYTRAMLNFDDACIFSRVIPVYKAPDEEGNYADPIMRQYNGMETNRPEVKKSEKPDKLNMAFYPEGGHLLSGVPCRIAFKATDQHGHGVPVEAIADRHGHALTLGLQHNGMGSFVYTTTKGKDKDKLTATYGGKKYTFTLPEVETVGCALQLDNNTSDGIQADITFIGALPDDLLAYTVTSSGKVVAFDTVRCSTGTRHLFINKEKMPTGVAQLTLYGASGAVYAQRLFFVDNGCPMVSVTVTADKEAYRPFDQVNLRLQAAATDSTTFSLAVRDAADYGTAYRDDIRTYMLLSSELKGLIEEPEWYFRPTPSLPHREVAQTREKEDGSSSASPQVLPMREDLGGSSDRVRALDLLMMVQGWTRYDWRMMAGVEPFQIRHYTEEQLVVDGWAFSRIKEEPLANTDVFIRLSSPDRQHRQETVIKTDSLGYWSLGVEDFAGEWDLYMETRQPGRNGEKRTTRIRMERSSAPGVYAYDPIDTYLPSYSWDADALLTVKEAEDPEYKLPTDAHLLDEVVVDGKRKYIDYCTFKAFDAEKDAELMIDAGNYTYKVEDYLRDKGYLVEYSQGDVGDMGVNGGGTDYFDNLVKAAPINNYRTLWYIHEGRKNMTRPSYFAGYAIDIEEVKSIIVYDDPHDFEGIPAVHEVFDLNRLLLFHQSDSIFPAGLYVVDIELNSARQRRTYVENNARATSFKGYDTPVEFYAPTYPDGPVQGDKDYRRTVYWNPEVTTDANGVANVSFYNNGYSRTLTVSAEGLTADGVPILNQ